jgi:DNA adenine methylase
MTAPVLRYHGGKFRIAQWLLSFFPEHTCYVESFGGAAGVLLNKKRVYAEVYNDLDGGVVNFFEVLRDPVTRQQLIDAVIMTPYARAEFDLAWVHSDDPVESARRLSVRAQMDLGVPARPKVRLGSGSTPNASTVRRNIFGRPIQRRSRPPASGSVVC